MLFARSADADQHFRPPWLERPARAGNIRPLGYRRFAEANARYEHANALPVFGAFFAVGAVEQRRARKDCYGMPVRSRFSEAYLQDHLR